MFRHTLELVDAMVLEGDPRSGHEVPDGPRREDLSGLRSVFANKVLPLLREYFYGSPAKVGMVLGDQAYERGATDTQPLVACVSFYRGDVKAFETTPLAVSEGLDAKTKALPARRQAKKANSLTTGVDRIRLILDA